MGLSAYLYDAIRTPFGRHGGALAGVRPDDLAAHVVRELLARSPDLDPERIGDVLFGNANGAGEDNRNVARMAVLLAGLPTSIPGATVNRLCGSSLDAAMQASRAIETGDASVVARRRRRVDEPRAVGAAQARARLRAHEPGAVLDDARLADGQPGDARAVDDLARRRARRSSRGSTTSRARRRTSARCAATGSRRRPGTRAATATGSCRCPDVELERDEGIRPDSSVEKLATLKPAFAKDGTVTAGNASPLNDGAGALLLGDEAAGAAIGREPLARIAGRGTAGVDPDVFGIAPVEAANRALERAGIGWDDVVVAELNEAFASQTLACLEGWPELDPEQLNVNGGAIAIGHPLGRERRAHPRHARARAAPARRRLRRRLDLHRRRPGPGRGAGGVMELLHPDYKSTRLRAPRRERIQLPRASTELTGPALWDGRVGALDHDLTRQHDGEPLGERIIVHGRVLEAGRAARCPDTLVEVWQCNAAGPLPPPGRPAPRAAGPELHRARPLPDGRRRLLSRS